MAFAPLIEPWLNEDGREPHAEHLARALRLYRWVVAASAGLLAAIALSIAALG